MCVRSRKFSVALSALVALSVVSWGVSALGGVSYDWQPTAAGTYTWNASANWLPVGIPNAADDAASFGLGGDTLGDITVTLDGDWTVNALTFADSNAATAAGWTIAAGTGTKLTLGGFAPIIDVGLLGTGKVATISASLDGTAGLTKMGAGTLVLSGANTLSGPVALNGGVLSVSSSGNLGDGSAGNTLSIDGGTLRWTGGTAADLGAARTLTIGFGVAVLDTTGAGALTLSGAIGGSSGFTKSGTGTLQLGGTSANTYAGTLLHNAGVIELAKTVGNAVSGNLDITPTVSHPSVKWLASDQIADTATVTLRGISGIGAGHLNLNGFNETIAGLTIINNQGTGSSTVATGAGTLTLLGNVSISGTSSATVVSPVNAGMTGNVIGNADGRLNLGGGLRTFDVSATGNAIVAALVEQGGIRKTGATTLFLTNAGNTFAGGLQIEAGTVSVAAAGALGSASNPITLDGLTATLATTADLVLAQPIGLGFAGGSIDVAASTTATLNGAATGSFATLTKKGAGTLLLGANERIDDGAFLAVAAGTLDLADKNETVYGVTLSGGTINGATGVLTAGFGFDVQAGSASAILAGGPLTKNGTGVVTLTGANTYVGTVAINGGTLSVNADAALGAAGNAIALQGGALNATASFTTTRGIAINGFSGNGLDAASGATLTLDTTITGVAGFTKNSLGTVELAGAVSNNFAGGVNVNNGLLLLNKTGGAFAIPAVPLTITSSASGDAIVRLMGAEQIDSNATVAFSANGAKSPTLDLNGFTQTLAGITMTTTSTGTSTGVNGIRMGANGTLLLNGDITFNHNRNSTGNTGREMLITSTGTYATGVQGNATLDLGGVARTITVTTNHTQANPMATIETTIVNGGIIKEGAGYLSLNANNTFTGGIVINAGRLRLAPPVASPNQFTGGITVNSGGTLWMYSVGSSSADFDNVYGSNAIAVNGGTILVSYSGQADRTLTDNPISIGALGATFNVTATSYTNFVETTQNQLRIANAAGVFSGSGTLTKTGGGRLSLNNESPGFSGAVVVENGTFEAIQRAGDGSATNTVTINGGNATLTGNPLQPLFVLNGGALSSQGGARTVAGDVNVTAASHIFLNDFWQDVGGARNMTIAGKLSGSAALNVEVNRAGFDTNSGSLILQNTANDYSGTITVGKNLRLENNAAAGAGKTINTADVVLAGGWLVLRDNGAGSNGTLAYGNNVAIAAPTGLLNNGDLAGTATIDVNRSGGANVGNVFQLGTLAVPDGLQLDVVGGNGYGLQFAGAATLAGAATFNPTTADITLAGGIVGGTTLTKSGTGKLILNGTSGYSGATTINGGTVLFGSPAAIGGSGASVTVVNGVAAAGYAIDQAFIDRISAGSTGVIAAASSSTNNLSLASLPVARLGAVGAATLSGTLTPGGSSYRLGGGDLGHVLTLPGTNVLTGTIALDVGIDGSAAGVVALTGSNDFTGLITISGGELLRPQTNASLGNAANVILADNGGIQFATGAAFDLFAARSTIFGSGGFILDTNGNDYTQPTAINGSGTGNFTKTGAGTLALGAASTFSGGTIVAGGTLAVDSDAKFGTSSGVTVAGGTLRYTGTAAETATHAYVFNSGAIEIANAAGNLTIASVVSGTGTNAIVKTGPGILSLTNTANTFTAPIVIDGGVLAYTGQGNANPTALGAGTKTVTLQNGGILRPLTNSDPSSGSKTFVIGAGGGAFDVPSGVTFTLNDGSQLAGSGTLTKTGAGTLVLGQASTGYAAYTGAIVLAGGQTNIYHASSLGDTAAGTSVVSGGTLEMTGTVTIAEPLTLAGFGSSGANGALRTPASAVTGTVNGPITLAGDAMILASSTSTINLANAAAITGTNRSVTLTGVGAGNIRGAVALGSGSITKTSTGAWALAGADGRVTSAGALNVSGGAFLLNNDGGLDVLDAANGDRLPDTMPINLINGGTLEMRGLNLSAAGASAETVGAINPDGQAFVKFSTATPTVTTTTLNATLGARTHNGVLFVQPSAGGTLGVTDRLIVSNPPAPLNGGTMVAPYFLNATAQNFLTYGVNGFADAAFTSTDLNTATSTDIVDQGATAVALGGNRTVLAAKLGTGAVTGNTLTLLSGGLIAAGSATHTTGFTFHDGTQKIEGVVLVPSGATVVHTGQIVAAALTKADSGELQLNPSTSAATAGGLNDATISVLAGTLRIGSNSAVNANAALPTSTKFYSAPGSTTIFQINSTISSLTGGGTVRVGTDASGSTAVTLTLNNAVNEVFSGTLQSDDGDSGDISFIKGGAGSFTLNGTVMIGRTIQANYGELILTNTAAPSTSTGTDGTGGRQRVVALQGGTFTLDNATVNNNNRLRLNSGSTGAYIQLAGGTFNFIGNNAATTDEIVGVTTSGTTAPTFGAGADVFNMVAGAGQAAIFTSALPFTRSAGASAVFRGTNLGGVRGAANTTTFAYGSAPTLTGSGALGTPNVGIFKGIVADSVVAGVDTYGLATYDAGTTVAYDADDVGIRRLAAAEMATTIPDGDVFTLNNVLVNSAIAGIDIGAAVNALHLAGGSIAGTGALTVNSGTILAANNGAAGSNSIAVGTLAFTGGEAIFFTASDLTVTSTIGGTTALTKGGPAVLTLAGTNTATGNVVVNGGLVAVDATARLGNAANTVALNNGGGLRATGTFSLNRTVTLGAAGGVLDVTAGNTLTVGTAIGGGAHASAPLATALTKTGAGTLELTAANTYFGGTTVAGGTLRVSANGATGAGAVTLDGGTLSSGGNFSITGPVLAGSGAHIIDPGTPFAPATFTLGGGLTTNANTTLHFDLFGGFSGDLLSIAGLTVGAGTQISFDANPSAEGNYRLIGGAFGSPVLGNFVLPGAPSGKSYSLSTAVDPGYIALVVAASGIGPGSGTWTNAGSNGLWTNDANWSGGNPQAAGHIATFAGAGAGTVNLNGNKTVGGVVLSAGGYTLGAAATADRLYMDNGGSVAAVSASAGNNAVNAKLTAVGGRSLAVAAAGAGTSLTLTGGIDNSAGSSLALTQSAGATLAAGNIVNNGPMTVAGTVGAGDVSGSGATTVSASASLTANSIVQDTLTIDAGGSVTIRAVPAAAAAGASAVPEPSTLALLAAGAAGLAALAWRRKRTP